MALIACPGCNRKVSSRSEVCSHCQYPLVDESGDKQQSFLRYRAISRSQRTIAVQSLALIAFTGGAALTFWLGVTSPALVLIGKALMALGMVTYIGVRVWQLMKKH